MADNELILWSGMRAVDWNALEGAEKMALQRQYNTWHQQSDIEIMDENMEEELLV